MRASEIINEYSSSKPLIVVDVQPYYDTHINFENDLAEYINRRTNNNTLMIFNGQEVTDDDPSDVKYWWHNNGMKDDVIESLWWVEKEYGYFRSWIDNGIDDSIIIKVIREMYNQKVTDSRDMFDGDVDSLEEFIGDSWESWMHDDNLSVEWISVGLLKEYSGCYLCGGGRDQCLKEIMILMNAFNIKYTLLDQFIYG